MPRLILELAIRCSVGNERELHDVDETGAQLADLESRNVRRHVGTQCVYLASDLVVFLVGIHIRLKLDGDDGDAVEDGRFGLLQIVELGDAILDGLCDQTLQIDRISARIDHGDEERRNLERRIFFARYGGEREPAHHDQTQKCHQRELVATNGKLEKTHDVAPALRTPRASRCSIGSRAPCFAAVD